MTVSSAGNIVASSSVLNQGLVQPGALTPDALMAYLQTRLGGLDEQIDVAFKKQQQVQAIRKELLKLDGVANTLSTEEDTYMKAEQMQLIYDTLNTELPKIDPQLANGLSQELSTTATVDVELGTEGAPNFIVHPHVTASDARAIQEAISSRMKLLESSAQLEMIQLQSVMSARQTAVQMCTNLISKLGQSDQAVAQNI